MDMRQDALLLARRGLRVLPLHSPVWSHAAFICTCHNEDCRSIGKHPRTKNGLTDATVDEDIIAEWWTMWPDANIGIATGDEFDVIDVDGPTGTLNFHELCEAHGYPAYSGVVKTGRDGGWHYYVTPGGHSSYSGGTAGRPPGIDVKGVGGYVVAPPSLHATGARYEWQHSILEVPHPGVPWSKWQVSIVPRALDELVIAQPTGNVSNGRSAAFQQQCKDRILRPVYAAGEGSRWQTLSTVGIMDFARMIAGHEIDEPYACSILEDVARDIGLSSSEIARIPRVLSQAVAKVHTPIVSRGAIQPTNGTISAAREALTAFPQATDDLGADVLRLAAAVETELLHMRARTLAKDQLRREDLATASPIVDFELPELLRKDVAPTRFRIDQLWPIGGIIVLTAQFKAGKTTLVGNIVRCLVDSGKFLSRYQCNALQGRVGLFDTEMSLGMLQAWLRDQAIENIQSVWTVPMKGQCSQFDITDTQIRAQWIERIRAKNIEVLILDCLGPMLAALGLDENSNQDIGKFINAFEALIKEAGVKEALIVHHMGHNAERARGGSRLRDWPDAEWQLIKEGQEDDNAPGFDVPRYFRAQGRDVNVPEQLLHYTPELRWLGVNVDDGSRAQVRGKRLATDMLHYVGNDPQCSQRAIFAAVKGHTATKKDVLIELIQSGCIVIVDGPNRATLHSLPRQE